jgi:hypothetical protein
MLTALLDALIDFVRVLVGWLVDVAVVLEGTPFSFAWPLLLALLLQVLLAAVGGVVWWARGVVWPINCGYPETTTGRGPGHNDVWESGAAVVSTEEGAGSAAPMPTSSPIFAAGKRSTTMAGSSSVTTPAVVASSDSTQSGSACCTTAVGHDPPQMSVGCCQWSSTTTATASPSSERRCGPHPGACGEAALPPSPLMTSSSLAS